MIANSEQVPVLKGRPIILGEVLFDQFPGGESVLGGAPFNVAWHLKGFGADPLFISRVGEDDPGERVRKAMEDWGLDRAGLQRDAHHPTGTVRVTLDGGQPTFTIMPDQAYDHIDAPITGSLPAAIGEGGLLYHGTLVLRTAGIRKTLETLLTGSGLPIFVDVNLRPPWWNESDMPAILRRARWVKVNDDELAIISRLSGCRTDDFMEMARCVRTAYDIHLLIVTRGGQGAVALDESGEPFSVEPEDSDDGIIDTVGAGDAFSAVVIMGLLRGWSVPTMMQRAQRFAGRVCRLRGAVTVDSDFYR
uniref:Fructokinase n=1 Tax=Candidatus Kentrum sp. FM TaxID=2126340 RepID=A0A450TJJ7_9GAMM|nr:MAG: fructokinase [Candidatus Kentron sp. FM]VFJ67580.1 MAG: fructokinase [Candidatus Kentron sp. FM]VFK16685.1 MAG: fructokinase [Candidatus Kentron sp. FM]